MRHARKLCARVVAEGDMRRRLLHEGRYLDEAAMTTVVANNDRCKAYLVQSCDERKQALVTAAEP